MHTVSGDSTITPEVAAKARIAVITSQFNGVMTSSLERHCLTVLQELGVPAGQIATFAVPGALEIPVVAGRLAQTKQYDVLIALGVVMKGETYHFELVADESARGCMDVAIKYDIPVIYEVLAPYTIEQAEDRTSDNEHNKGREAALAAAGVLQTLSGI